jgi:hypothetical protein
MKHRTVERLTSMRNFVEGRKKFSQKQLDMLLQKLLAHETKYVDISTKLHVGCPPYHVAHAYSSFSGLLRSSKTPLPSPATRVSL